MEYESISITDVENRLKAYELEHLDLVALPASQLTQNDKKSRIEALESLIKEYRKVLKDMKKEDAK